MLSSTSMGHYSFDPYRPLMDIHILVVDDDTTTLNIVSAMLRTWSYKVMSVKNPLDALATLRTQKGLIDLVVTDLHMPYMNGFELQQQIDREFKLPVVMMSADDKESVVLRSLQNGIALFILKPVNPNDLKNVWQYAVKAKKGKSVMIEEIGSSTNDDIINSINQDIINNIQEEEEGDDQEEELVIGEASGTEAARENIVPLDTSMINKDNDSNNNNNGSGSTEAAVGGTLIPVNQEGPSSGNDNRRPSDTNRKGPKKPRDQDGRDGTNNKERKSRRKSKVVWTNSLHNRFLLAIRHLGLDKAVPKRILEFMNVPGLTRENVASHLQKYRLFLKKVAEKGLLNATQVLADRVFRSSFASGYPQLMLKNLQVSRNRPFRLAEPSFAPNFNNNNNNNIVPSSINPSPSVVNLNTSNLCGTTTTTVPATTTTPFRAFPLPAPNFNNHHHHEASSSSSVPLQPARVGLSSLLMSNTPRPANVVLQQQQPIQLNRVYQPNRTSVSGFGGVTAPGFSNYMVNGTNSTNPNLVAIAPAVNPYGLVSNANTNGGFMNSAGLFNGTIRNRPEHYPPAGGNMMGAFSSTNAPYNYNYLNGGVGVGGAGAGAVSSVGMSQMMINGGQRPTGFFNGGYGMGIGVPNFGNYMNGMQSTNYGYPQMGGQFGAGSSSSGQYYGFGNSTNGTNPAQLHVFPNNINYMQQQNAYNLPQRAATPPPPPPPRPLPPQQQFHYDLPNLGGENNGNVVGGENQALGGDVINNDPILGVEFPIAGNLDDFGGDPFLEQLNNLPPLNLDQRDEDQVPSDLSDISYQTEVNPSANQIQNFPAADQFSTGPNHVQENSEPNNGQSFGQAQQQDIEQAVMPNPNGNVLQSDDYFPIFDQNPYEQQGIGEVLDANQLLNIPANLPNETDDWDEYMDAMLNDFDGSALTE